MVCTDWSGDWGGGIRQETRDLKENVEGKVKHVEKWEIHIFS